jgi:hypothetical protein
MGLAALESRPVRWSALWMFGALFLCYLAMSPGTVLRYGYITEEVESGLSMMARFTAYFKDRPLPPMVWSRHGPVPVLLDIPFLKLGKFVISPEFALSFQLPLLTAGLMALSYLWLRKICSPATSLFLTLAGAFGTMLWPYAYIGLETKQSFFVLLAGYLGLARGKIRGWPGVLAFTVVCGLAMTMKSTGVVLWPAIAYLIYVQFRDDWRHRYGQLLASGAVIFAMCAGNVVLRDFYWDQLGGGGANLQLWLIQSKFQYFSNLFGLLGSPAKGLFIFAPVLVAVLWAIPRAFRVNREIAVFSALVLACMMAFLSILSAPYDETWGPRFLHVAVAPLLLCIGAAWPVLQWRVHLPLAVLAVVGVVISFLGAFFYYGNRAKVSNETHQNTMEWLISDPLWNEIAFSARLFEVWLRPSPLPVTWTPAHTWVWTAPPDTPAWRSVDLRRFGDSQSFVFYYWKSYRSPQNETLFRFYVSCFAGGVLLLGVAILGHLDLRRDFVRSRLNGFSRRHAVAALAAIAVVASALVWIAAPASSRPKLLLNKAEVVAGQTDYTLRIAEMPNALVVVRYSIDSAEPQEMTVLLDSTGSARFDVLAGTTKGVYRMLGFKRKQDTFWFDADAAIAVK